MRGDTAQAMVIQHGPPLGGVHFCIFAAHTADGGHLHGRVPHIADLLQRRGQVSGRFGEVADGVQLHGYLSFHRSPLDGFGPWRAQRTDKRVLLSLLCQGGWCVVLPAGSG